MTEGAPDGITVSNEDERVVIEVRDGRWEGSPAEAERLLTRLHYVLARARPGTNIASVFLNGQLWGGKTIETDRDTAVREMQVLIDQLARRIASMNDEDELTPLGD